MAYDVTSWFIEQTLSQNPAPIVRKFLIGTSDYSDRVTKWPKFKQVWDDIKPTTLTMKLANEDGALNVLRDDKLVLRSEAEVQFGFTHTSSGDELITQYLGKTSRVKFARGAIDITLTDKFEQLGSRVIGSSDDPVTYAGSNYLPADIAWYAVTSYGGYSAIESTSNPDIDYESFTDWRDRFSADATYMNANLEGLKCLELVRKIGRHTLSAIYTKEGKISFQRFTIGDANVSSLNSDNLQDLTVEFSDRDMVNRQYTYADYSVESDYWQTNVLVEDATSVNSYGPKEETEKDDNIWYVGSGGALNLGQNITQVRGEPYDKLTAMTYLHGFTRLVGETIHVKDDFMTIDSAYRVMGREVDMDSGKTKFYLDRSQFSNEFILDTSSLNGDDVLT